MAQDYDPWIDNQRLQQRLAYVMDELERLRKIEAAAKAELEHLRQENTRLKQGLIRARQNLFPNIDQRAVIERDFPPYALKAALTEAK